MKCTISEPAKADIRDARKFLLKANPAYCRRVMRGFTERFNYVAHHPGMGSDRGDLSPGLRSVNSDDYRVFFRTVNNATEIVRIIHSSRDVTAGTFTNPPADEPE